VHVACGKQDREVAGVPLRSLPRVIAADEEAGIDNATSPTATSAVPSSCLPFCATLDLPTAAA
jgi:hypothetical protein